MSAKSAVKVLLPAEDAGRLFALVAALTGSKNTLKGIGYFLGGILMASFGFQGAVGLMLAALSLVFLASLLYLRADLGRSRQKPRFAEIFATSHAVNRLSLARLFLFSARDVWFVVALPVYLAERWLWSYTEIGSFLAAWIIGYGLVQATAPAFTRSGTPAGKTVWTWGLPLSLVPLVPVLLSSSLFLLLASLLLFGVLFAVNSSLHSFLIVDYARSESVSLDVGFYYMANALGRLFGTLLSGAVYQFYGFSACLLASALLLALAATLARPLPAAQSTCEV